MRLKLKKNKFILQLLAFITLLPCVSVSANKESEHWSYEGSRGAEHWGDLSKNYSLCKLGKHQSPINLGEALSSKNNSPIIFHYDDLFIAENPHTVEIIEKPIKSIEIEGKTYNLAQFHFHSPSEHSVDHNRYDLELHFVHRGENNKIVVLGVFFKQGKSNLFIKELLARITKNGQKFHPLEENDLDYLLPKNKDYFHYMGSLTTPPCSEEVGWYILKNPVEASREEIAKLKKILKFNARPIQKQEVVEK